MLLLLWCDCGGGVVAVDDVVVAAAICCWCVLFSVVVPGGKMDLDHWSTEGMHDEYRWSMYSNAVWRIKTLLGMDEGGNI